MWAAKDSYRTVTPLTSPGRELVLDLRGWRKGQAVTECLPLEAIILLGAISEPDAIIRQRPTLAWEIDEHTGKPVGRWIMGAAIHQATPPDAI